MMKNFRLSKLSLNNYKLFKERNIDFENSNLFVLDGPNGYGKTSIFEAIEYLLTGNIERAEKCPEISGKLKYDNHFLANDNTKPIIVKGELISEREVLIIERIIDVISIKGLENNPKNLRKNTNTKIYINGDFKYEGSVEGAQKLIEEVLGTSVTKYYNKFYYISQEDRLSFLMDTEQNRMEQINTLFDINEEIDEYTKFNKFKTKLAQKLNTIRKDNLAERKKVEKYKKSIGESKDDFCQYTNIFDEEIKIQYWNEKIVKIQEKEKLEEILKELSGVVKFSNYSKEFTESIKNSQYKKYIESVELIKKYLILQNSENDLEKFKIDYETYYFLKKLPKDSKTEELDFEKFKFVEIKDKMSLDVDISEAISIKIDIENCRKNQSAYNKSLEKFQIARENLTASLQQWNLDGGEAIEEFTCPYCGSDLQTKEKYESYINDVTEILENCNDIETIKIKQNIDRLAEIYKLSFKDAIEDYLNEKVYYEKDEIVNIIKDWKDIIPTYTKFIEFLNNDNFPIEKFQLPLNKYELWDSNIREFIDEVNANYLVKLSDEYLVTEKVYDFNNIFAKIYEGDLVKVKPISQEQENNKRKYLEEQYQLQQFVELERQENELLKQEGIVAVLEDMKNKVDDIVGIYKAKIQEFQGRVIGRIQIPLYIYSGRILQNYQGGLGVFIKSDKKEEKLDSIRLLSSNQTEHDILYTLSSGQLTGVIIALTLTLNKIYGEEKFPCIMIDDPVQTMDDLNTASLVELLRNEFNDYQLIVSTHEDDFSRYIRYKYEKYHLVAKKISLNVSQVTSMN